MIALCLPPLFLCALAARVSGYSMDGSLATTASAHSLHRRGLSIDLNKAPAHHIDLNEMPDSDGEQGHHVEGKSLSHASRAASPRQPQHLLSRPVTPSSAQNFVGEPSFPLLAGGKRKSSKLGALFSSATALSIHSHSNAGSSNHVPALFNKGKERDEQGTAMMGNTRSHSDDRWKEQKKLEKEASEEVATSLNRQPYTPMASKQRKAVYDARHREKKRLLGYKFTENLRDEHRNKGLTLEKIKIRQGLDPSVTVPPPRPWKRIKLEEGSQIHVEGETVWDLIAQQAAARDAERRASIVASARPGKQTRAGSHRR